MPALAHLVASRSAPADPQLSNPWFTEIHFLTSYPGTLLNRDDAGFAKRLPFGGAVRTRISSQCLKRHWRTYQGEHGIAAIEVDGNTVPMSIRSRRTFERYVFKPLIDDDGVDEAVASAITNTLLSELLGKSEKAKAKSEAKGEDQVDATKFTAGRTGQVTVLGRPEVDYLLREARALAAESPDAQSAATNVKARIKEISKNLDALRLAMGLDAALFGRMITSDHLARGDAAVHVAHAFTVHEESTETDYFSAVDDLLSTEEVEALGSGHIGNVELTSGLFYGYVVVDVPLLVSNLEGCQRSDWQTADRSLSAEVVRRLVHVVSRVSPGAKLGSTAPYAYAHMVLAESGTAQPRTLANAFLKPVAQRPDLVKNAYLAVASYLTDIDAMYGTAERRKLAALGPVDALEVVSPAGDRGSLGETAAWAAEQVRAG